VVDIDSVPLLDGSRQTIADGILSSLHPQNAQAAADVDGADAASRHPLWPVLFDPQTGTCPAVQS
jgi:selenide,water dikinase